MDKASTRRNPVLGHKEFIERDFMDDGGLYFCWTGSTILHSEEVPHWICRKVDSNAPKGRLETFRNETIKLPPMKPGPDEASGYLHSALSGVIAV